MRNFRLVNKLSFVRLCRWFGFTLNSFRQNRLDLFFWIFDLPFNWFGSSLLAFFNLSDSSFLHFFNWFCKRLILIFINYKWFFGFLNFLIKARFLVNIWKMCFLNNFVVNDLKSFEWFFSLLKPLTIWPVLISRLFCKLNVTIALQIRLWYQVRNDSMKNADNFRVIKFNFSISVTIFTKLIKNPVHKFNANRVFFKINLVLHKKLNVACISCPLIDTI